MPSLKDATKKPANVGEPIEVAAPRVAQGTPPPPYVPNNRGDAGLAVGSMGPAPASFTTSYDSVKMWVRPGVSQSRFPPLPVKANPQSNAQSSSVTSKQLAPVNEQIQGNTATIAALGAQPGPVTGLAVSKSVFKDSTGTLRQALEISFTHPTLTGDPTRDVFAGVSIWVTFPGDEPRGLGTGITSPVVCQLPIDGSTVTLTVQSYSVNGVDNDFSSCPTINVTLDGVTTAPAAPTISSALASCNSGLTFSWNIVSDPLHDVIDCYRVYRNTVNNSATATLISTVPQPATGTGTNVFTDVIGPGLVYYYWVSCENLQQLESTLTAAQSGAVTSGAIAYQGAYSGSITYFPGASVTYSGQFYTCILQSTGNLPTNATYWQPTGSTSSDVFLGTWLIGTAYVAGNQVTYSGGYYISILNGTGKEPDISPTYWQLVGSVNTYIYTGAYNGGTSYNVGNQVTYRGSYWICISSSTGNAPSTTSSYWTLVGTSAILLGVYSGATAYVQGNEVTYLGNIYQCILASTGNLPTNVTYWQLTGTSSVLLGVYAGGTAYVAGNEVTYLGGTYKCILASTGNLPTNQTYWTLIGTNSQFLGAYSGSTAYVAGNQVTYQNNFYVCILASTGNLPTNATYWQLVSINNSTFLGAYNGSTAYIIGNQVTYNGNYYTCTAATTGNLPTNASYWQQIATSEIYLGAYNGSTAYVAGNQVSYLGSFWICILASTGNAPSIAPSYWTLLGTSTILIGAWSSSTAYVRGNEVTYNGNFFQALLANTNQTPPTPPTTSSYWQCVGPTNLGNLPDGPSNFSATASTLSYRPLTNPLTANDAGANVTINIAAFTMRTSSKGDISENSGSITPLSYSTLYYIYFDDATLTGGAVTYYATTTKTTAINGVGRFFVGSIMTPKATAPDTVGNNDGGVGAQSGFTGVFLYGLTTNAGGTASNPNNAIDGDLTTYATILIGGSGAVNQSLTLSQCPASAQTWSSLTLNVLSAVPSNGTHCTVTLDYSIDGGTSWTNIFSNAATTRVKTTDTISLAVNQNPALVLVRLTVAKTTGNSDVAEGDLYEAWIKSIF